MDEKILAAWPRAEIETCWREGGPHPILQQATTCIKCCRQGHFVCVYGGHMICADCADAATECVICSKNSTFSTFSKKKEPKWPLRQNPFAYMYCSNMQLPNTNMQLPNTNQIGISYIGGYIQGPLNVELRIRSWQYPQDRFPSEFTVSVKRYYHPAWRISVEIGQSIPLSLMRCRCMWTSSTPMVCLKKIQSVFAALNFGENWRLISHPRQMFMFAQLDRIGTVKCLICQQNFPSLSDFAQSTCSLFSLIELASFSGE